MIQLDKDPNPHTNPKLRLPSDYVFSALSDNDDAPRSLSASIQIESIFPILPTHAPIKKRKEFLVPGIVL